MSVVVRTQGRVETGLILAAGQSSRMGQPKGLLQVGHVPLVRAHVDRLEAHGLRVVVVLGAVVEPYLAVLPSTVEVRFNLDWATTDMAFSAAIGLAGLGDALLTPVDVPPAAPDTLDRLLRAVGDAVPNFRGRDGHPVRLATPHTVGRLDQRLACAARVVVEDPDCILNFNTPADWADWNQRP